MRKQFTTKMAINYSIVLEKGNPNCIIVEDI